MATSLHKVRLYKIRLPLAGINFFLSDVASGLGPFLAIYLIAVQKWNTGNIGLILTIAGLVTMFLQTPAGAVVDVSRYKRGLLSISIIVVIVSTWAISVNSSFLMVAISQAFAGAADAFMGPLVAGMTLGMVGRIMFSRQFGENQTYGHAGNVFTAAITGLLTYYIALKLMFYVVIVTGCCALFFVAILNKRLINNKRARGAEKTQEEGQHSSVKVLFKNKVLRNFGFAVLCFHLANAAMLILVGEDVSKASKGDSIIFVAGSIIAAQFVMVFMALLVRNKANKWGRKPIFLIAFIILPIRGILFTFSDKPYYLLCVQLLDGVGAGIYGALFPIVVEDLMAGTGRYNIAFGAISTMQGIGAALSNLVAGYLAEVFGFHFTFYVLAGIAVIGLGLFFFRVPETMPSDPALQLQIQT